MLIYYNIDRHLIFAFIRSKLLQIGRALTSLGKL